MTGISATADEVTAICAVLPWEDQRRLVYVPAPGEDNGTLMVPADLVENVEAALDAARAG